MILEAALAAALWAGATPPVGAPAPDFTLPSQKGTPVSLKELRGKWVVLYFYPKDFTRGCTIEAHNFERDLKRYQALDAVIVGVSMQSSKSHSDFCVKEGLDFILLADEDGKVSRQYESEANYGIMKLSQRNTFLIAPDGTLARAFEKVSPNEHSAQVLEALSSLSKRPRKDAKKP